MIYYVYQHHRLFTWTEYPAWSPDGYRIRNIRKLYVDPSAVHQQIVTFFHVVDRRRASTTSAERRMPPTVVCSCLLEQITSEESNSNQKPTITELYWTRSPTDRRRADTLLSWRRCYYYSSAARALRNKICCQFCHVRAGARGKLKLLIITYK